MIWFEKVFVLKVESQNCLSIQSALIEKLNSKTFTYANRINYNYKTSHDITKENTVQHILLNQTHNSMLCLTKQYK